MKILSNMTNTTIYFIRHAKPGGAGKDNFEDSFPEYLSQRGLSEEGKEETLKIIPVFDDIKIDKIYSSSAGVAIETVTPLANKLGLEINKTDLLKERLLSVEPVVDFQQAVQKTWEDFDFKYLGAESNREAQTRVRPFIDKILEEDKGKSIIVSSHGVMITLILNLFDNNYSWQFWKELKLPDVIKAEFKDNVLVSTESIM